MLSLPHNLEYLVISIEQISEMFGTEKPCDATLTMDEFKACVETCSGIQSNQDVPVFLRRPILGVLLARGDGPRI